MHATTTDLSLALRNISYASPSLPKQYVEPKISVKGLTIEVAEKFTYSRGVHVDDEMQSVWKIPDDSVGTIEKSA